MARCIFPISPGFACAIACLLIPAARTAAQGRALDESRAGHRITVHTVVQLSFEQLDIAPDVQARVFPLPGGGWGVSAGTFNGVIQRFDAAGTPAKQLGRAGHGPGEFAGDIYPAAVGGGLWVVDPRNSRLSIFSKALDYAADRHLQLSPWFVAPTRDRTGLLVSGSARSHGVYYSVVRISRTPGADVFGEPLGRQPLPPSQWLIGRRIAAETANGEVWAVAMSGGMIDVLRSRDLSLLTQLRLPGKEMAREASWGVTDLNTRPAPRVIGLTADSAGVLWMSVAVADSTWTRGMDPRKGVTEYWDTRVLAVDPGKRSIVGMIQIDDLCMSVEDSLLSCVDELSQTIRVVSLALEPRRGG